MDPLDLIPFPDVLKDVESLMQSTSLDQTSEQKQSMSHQMTGMLQDKFTSLKEKVLRRSSRLPFDFNAHTPLRSNMLGQTPEWVFEGNQSLDSDEKVG